MWFKKELGITANLTEHRVIRSHDRCAATQALFIIPLYSPHLNLDEVGLEMAQALQDYKGPRASPGHVRILVDRHLQSQQKLPGQIGGCSAVHNLAYITQA